MKLIYFKGKVPNFGDELNTYIWPKILPHNFLDEDESELFIGIGSILFDDYPKKARKYVMGSGYAGYTPPPNVHDGTWDVSFVRGPRTAKQLNISERKAIADSAILLRTLDLPGPKNPVPLAFMPHYESLERGFWAEACEVAGIPMIDPTDDIEKVIGEIKGTKMLITEAMHGAIVADALRTPWLGVRPLHAIHHQKWHDWAEALDIDLKPQVLKPSSSMELYVQMTGGRGKVEGRAGRWGRSPLALPLNKAMIHRAAAHLKSLEKFEPQLSRDAKIGEATERAMQAVNDFVRGRAAAA